MAQTIKRDTLHVKNLEIRIYTEDFKNEFISLTDIAKYKSDDANAAICNWMRNRETLEFLGIWESLHNPEFKPLEFEGFRMQAGLNAFTMSPKKNTQHATRNVYQYVSEQDFSKPWNDEALYKKYSLSEEEIQFFESMIKEME